MFDGLLKKYAGSLVRHGLTIVSGFLLAKGLAPADAVQAWIDPTVDLIVAIVVGSGGIWLSLIEKKARAIWLK